METLKLKVFDVLSQNIPVAEFEQWLYSEPSITNAISSNTLVYDVIAINYKNEDSLDKLLKLTFEKFSSEESLLALITISCCKIINSENKKLIFNQVSTINSYFNYDTEYNLLWEFFELNEQISLIEETFIKEGDIVSRIKQLATHIIEEFENCHSLEEKLKVLNYGPLEPIRTNSKPWWRFWK